MSDSINNSEDLLDSRNIQERIDELSKIPEEDIEEWEKEELDLLIKFKDDVDSSQWNDGITFIRDSYFEEDSEEFAYNCMGIDRDSPISKYVDWERFSDDRKSDHKSVDFDGINYWFMAY